MRTLTGFTSEASRQANIASGRITASQAANLPLETSAISSNIPNNSIAITPSSLQPITPLTVPTNQPITSDSAIIGSMASNMTASDALIQSQQNIADTSKNSLTDLYSQLMDVNTATGNVNSSVDRTAQNEARLQADQYTNQIEAEQLSNRRQIEKLQNENPTGMLEGGLNAQINDINRKSLSKQADLALLQNAANRNYTSMAAVATEQVANNLAALTAQSNNLTLFITQNQSNLTSAEKNLFDLQKAKVDAELAKKTANEDVIKDIKLAVAQNGGSMATLNALSALDTSKPESYEKALILASGFLTDPLDRKIKIANLNKLNADTAKTNAEAEQAKKLGNLINLDPTSKTYTDQMIDGSKGGRVLTQSEVLPITKGLTVVNQIGALQQTLKGQDTGPILGILRDNNPYDIKAKLINAQLQALIPNLARGVYGEVGVLTNTDIDNYKQTLGNIKTPEEANNLLLAMTLSTIKSSLDNNFQTMAAAGRDVSGFKGIYSNLKTQLDTLNNNLGVSQISNNANSYLDSALPQEAPAPSGPVSWLNNFFYGKK